MAKTMEIPSGATRKNLAKDGKIPWNGPSLKFIDWKETYRGALKKPLSFFSQVMELAEAEPKGDLSRWDTKKAAAISSSQSVFRFPATPGCCGHQPSNATKKTVLSASLMLHCGWPITCICCFSHSISVPCAEGVLSFERTAWWNDCLSIMNRTRRCFRKHITNGIIISPIDC